LESRRFRDKEQAVSPLMSGTRHTGVGYPTDLPNRPSTGILKKPTVIDRAWETGRSTTFKIEQTDLGACHALQQRIGARARTASIGNANL
jgi:hypothetical protein